MSSTTQWALLLSLFASMAGCSSPSDEDQSDDDDSDSEVDPTDKLGIDCQGAHLFDYGKKKYSEYKPGPDDTWLPFYETVFYYDSDKKVISTEIKQWDAEGNLGASYQGIYEYDADGRPTLYEWEKDGVTSREIYYYQDGRLQETAYENDSSGAFETSGLDTYEYSAEGRPLRRISYVYDSVSGDNGLEYEYDDKGLLVKEYTLDPDNDWAKTDSSEVLEYDDSNRYVGGTESYENSDGQMEEWINACNYDGETGWLSQCTFAFPDGSMYVRDYQHEDKKVTIVVTYEADGTTEPVSKTVIECTDEGSSAIFEHVNPVPTKRWITHSYGNGVINGCAGFDI